MGMRIYLLWTYLLSGWLSAQTDEQSLVHIPKGQIKANPVKVYVSNAEITLDDAPRLLAYSAHSNSGQVVAELKPSAIISDSKFTDTNGQLLPGTLLLFDFSKKDHYAKLSGEKLTGLVSGLRFFPVGKWGEEGESSAAGVDGETVLIGNLKTSGTSVLAVIVVLGMIVLFVSHRHKGSALAVLKSDEGNYSLSKAQLLAWTIAATYCVGVFGMAQQVLPDIPTTLIALLGLSVLTTGSAYASPEPPKDEAKAAAAKKQANADGTAKPRSIVLDLISVSGGDGGVPKLSIAKVQMLLWTVISLILFVSKSLLEGSLWDIPWELVVLMGVSQTSYVVPKYWKGNPVAATPTS